MSGMKELNYNIIRPLLSISKAELSVYAAKHDIEWRQEESNKHNTYTRNIWRNVLIPDLKKTIPHIDDSVMKLQDVFRIQVEADERFVESKVNTRMDSFILLYEELGAFNSNQWIEFLNLLKIPLSLAICIQKFSI